MKTSLLLILVFAVIGLSAVNDLTQNDVLHKTQKPEYKVPVEQVKASQNNRLSKVNEDFPGGLIWFEDFEEGGIWHRWTSGQIIPQPDPNYWHLTTWNALGDSSWWLANEDYGNYGGYANHWYQVLETPLILLDDTSATFTFYQRYKIEDPAGVEDPYDGWDGMNVRISTDSGVTWQVLDFSTYNVTSSWAFGHPDQGMNEGPGIPSWAGTQETWRKETIDLSAYCNADTAIMLRFAFASDMGYSTEDGGPDLWSWQIDSIMVFSPDSLFFANYGTSNGMVGKSVLFVPPPGGDLWHVTAHNNLVPPYEENPDFVPSGTNIAVVQHGSDNFSLDSTYNSWMQNYYTTGPIALPDTTPIYIDLLQLPYFADDAYGDWWQVQVRPVDSTDFEGAWREWTQNPNTGEWYWAHWVYNNVAGIEEWTTFSYYWGALPNTSPLDISRFAGQDVYLRIFFNSDGDEPLGPGLMIDDIVVFAPINPPEAPTNLNAEVNNEDTTVTITWDWEDGKTYEIWRTTPGDQYVHLKGITTESSFIDTTAEPFQVYYYTMRAAIQYEGTSDWSDFVGAYIVPSVLKEFKYDNSSWDGFYDPGKRVKMAVKFTPEYFPVSFNTFRVFLDTSQVYGRDWQGKGKFYAYNENPETGMPDSLLASKIISAGLETGMFNVIQFDETVQIDTGAFFIVYDRYTRSPHIAADTTSPIYLHTYSQVDDTTWTVVDSVNALIRVYVDTSKANYPQDTTAIGNRLPEIADRFILGDNYPNPFNPATTIPFVVPARAAGQDLRIDVYNILGQKVTTLFNGKAKAGLHKLEWKGLNSNGRQVGSGIYFYKLKSGDVQLYKRMLLLK